MKRTVNILLLTCLLFAMAGCNATKKVLEGIASTGRESEQLIQALMAEPEAQELTSSVSLSLNGTKVSGQLRMRRDRSIQISASVLGLMEVGRIEFLPEMVVVMDKVHNVYSVCHYADIPYRNELGLDFNVVQALLWDRIFAPGAANAIATIQGLSVEKADANGNIAIRNREYGYVFNTKTKKHVESVSLTRGNDTFRLDYNDFSEIKGLGEFPTTLSFHINPLSQSGGINLSAKLSSISAEKKNWADQTQVSRRMKQVTLDELLDKLEL